MPSQALAAAITASADEEEDESALAASLRRQITALQDRLAKSEARVAELEKNKRDVSQQMKSPSEASSGACSFFVSPASF